MSETPTPDLSERAREEAERRWPVSHTHAYPNGSTLITTSSENTYCRHGFMEGAAWAAEQSATHDEQVRREARAEALREAADDLEAHGQMDAPAPVLLRLRADAIARDGGAR